MSYPSVVNHLMDLYDIDIDFDEDKVRYMAKTTIAGIPIIGDIYRSYDNMRYMEDYINNRGLSWDDIKYPTRTQGMQGFGSTLNYLSKNIYRLYS
jgi:hypothetical protein